MDWDERKEIDEPEPSDTETLLHSVRRPSTSKRSVLFLLFLTGTLTGATLLLIVQTLLQSGSNLDSVCASHTAHWSPIHKDLSMSPVATRFNTTLFGDSEFRQDAGEEVDKAWNALGLHTGYLIVDYEDGLKAGLDPTQVRVKEELGGGFIAKPEALHQLHCLNMLRMGLWYNYPYYSQQPDNAFAATDNFVHLHFTHCYDLLRERLMCTADTGLVGNQWINHGDAMYAYPKFTTKHTCANYDAIIDWAKARAHDDMDGEWLWEPEVPESVPSLIP